MSPLVAMTLAPNPVPPPLRLDLKIAPRGAPHRHRFCSIIQLSLSLTQVNFRATSLKPFCSKRSMILPTSPRWTPSGLTMMKVRSLLAAIATEIIEKSAKMEPSICSFMCSVGCGKISSAIRRLAEFIRQRHAVTLGGLQRQTFFFII